MIRPLALAALLTATAHAQEPLTFQTLPSGFQLTGTTSIGPIQDSATSNGLGGDLSCVIDAIPTAGPSSIQFLTGGSLLVDPDLDLSVRGNFGSEVMQIHIVDLEVAFTSPEVAVDPATGDFATLVTPVVLGGTAHLVPTTFPFGSPTTVDLTGTPCPPRPINGTVVIGGARTSLNTDILWQLNFTDPDSGTTVNLTLDGFLNARSEVPAPAEYCTAALNSTGSVGNMHPIGSPSISERSLSLGIIQLPPNTFTLLFFGTEETFIPGFAGSAGNLCVSGSLFRLNNFLLQTGSTGHVGLLVPFTNLPPGAEFHPGETWYFQAWYRDAFGSVQTSNMTNGVRVTFCP